MQTVDFVSGLHNCREFSQPLECLHQDMQTQEKKFSITFIKQEDARRRLRGMCGFKKELRVCWMEMEVE